MKAVLDAEYVGFRGTVEAFSSLKAGRGDALTTDDTVLYAFLGENCDFRILDERLSSEPYGLGFKQSPLTHSFQQAVNQAISGMKADGTLERLHKKWMGPFLEMSKTCENSKVLPPGVKN